jgi:hypothetical protein
VRLAAAALVAIAAAALPSVAQAGLIKFGSSLTAPANKSEAHPVDAVFWANKLPDGARVKAPERGKVGTIKLKGTAVKRGSTSPVTLFHFQILHPIGDGRVKVSLTSGPFHVPVGGDPNRITTYHPVNLCAKKGDYVAFNDVGGYKAGKYPNGTPFRVFSSVPAATTNFYSKAGATGNNREFKGAPHVGEELLMRMFLSTGEDAGYCRNH